MKLSKKMVSLICLSCSSMIIISSSGSDIVDNSNLSSIESINENTNSVIKSEEDKIIENEVVKNDISEEDTNISNINSYDSDQNNEEIIKEEIEEIIERDVTYSRNNMKVVSDITKDELEKVFLTYRGANTMSHLAQAFVDAEREYGVNAFAMAGIVALESGFATSRRAVEDNNLTGYEVYSDDSEGRLFKSQYESIMQTAKHLSNNYLKEGGLYYNGLSVDAVQMSYCPDKSNNWHNKVDMLASGFLRTYKEIEE